MANHVKRMFGIGPGATHGGHDPNGEFLRAQRETQATGSGSDDVAATGDAVTRARANLIEIAYRDEIRTVLAPADDLRVVLREFTRQAERIKELEAERDYAVSSMKNARAYLNAETHHAESAEQRVEAAEKRNAELEERLGEAMEMLRTISKINRTRDQLQAIADGFLATLKEKHNDK